jgi:hypothetical protein
MTRHQKFRVPNRLAGFAALLLIVTSLAGTGSSLINEKHSAAAQNSVAETVDTTPITQSARTDSAVSKKKGFKVSLFLFRHH